MRQKTIDRYIEIREYWLELLFRLCLGVQQVKYRPYYYFIFVPVFIVFEIMWQGRDILISAEFIPKMLISLFMTVTSVLLVLMFILFLTAMIKQFGIWASRDWESKFVRAFTKEDLRENGYPILISSRYDKNGILILTFYSHIHKRRWEKRKADIEEQTGLNIYTIEYGGKNKEKGHYKVIYAIRRGDSKFSYLHDEELNKELDNVD